MLLHPLNIGDVVQTTEKEVRDYSDCDAGDYGISIIPAGSIGTIIGRQMDLQGAWRYPVRFEDIENYPTLYYNGEIIGEGHYVDEKKLKKLDMVIGKEFEPVGFDDINELFNCLYGE